MTLRAYQADGVAAILAGWESLTTAGKRPSVVRQLPTGGGKSVEIKALSPDLVIAPGIDLCRQLRASIGCDVETTTGMAKRLKDSGELPPAGIVVFDEGRAITSPGVGPVVDWYLAHGAKVAIFDATPETAQGQGLGSWAALLIQGPSVRELTAAGHLVPTRCYSCDPGRGLARRPVDVWLELYWHGRVLKRGERAPFLEVPHPRRALVFCKDKAHARDEVAAFAAKGVPAAFIGADTSEKERRELLGWTDAHGVVHEGALARGEVWALCCAVLLRQGYDEPKIELICLARGFDSEPLFRQAIGRGMRPCEEIGKADCVLVDLVGGLFSADGHGLPDDPRSWHLDGQAARVALLGMPAIVQCPACGAWGRGGVCEARIFRNGLHVVCGFALPKPPPPKVQARDLFEARRTEAPEQKQDRLIKFVQEAIAKGRNPWSAQHRYRGTYDENPPRAWMLAAIRENT